MSIWISPDGDEIPVGDGVDCRSLALTWAESNNSVAEYIDNKTQQILEFAKRMRYQYFLEGLVEDIYVG